MKARKPYKIIGAYDSETTNINQNGELFAFPILHQLGIIKDGIELKEIYPENVEQNINIELFRHSLDLFSYLDTIVESENDYVPVICCHNLSFDMYSLSSWLNEHENVRVLAKSVRKPITFTICDSENNPKLVIWDTLIFSQQSLSRMGDDCGYSKAVGEWDYSLIRTPETELINSEINYAKRDIYALIAWLGWWLRRNPEIEPDKLGLNVVTKTGVVRERIRKRFDQVKSAKAKYNVGRFNHFICRQNVPKSDDELFTMIAATRGGFTFCASENASKPFTCVDDSKVILGYDATSQHPAQMVSHRYPVLFHETSAYVLELAFENIARRDYNYVLDNWSKPFNSGIYALYEFENIRPKKDSLFEKFGIMPLASARFKSVSEFVMNEDNQDAQEFNAAMQEKDYKDMAINPTFAFGKLVKADKAQLYLTELAIWEVAQAYEWDSVKAIKGYIAGKFVRPSDQSTLAVMQFYEAKNAFKQARHDYFNEGTIHNEKDLKRLNIPEFVIDSMKKGELSKIEVESVYLSLKADLNSLFGIQATNEYRRDTVLNDDGISYQGEFGLCNKPKNPKAWYQFGQRIVGWSRIAQICIMYLMYPYIETIINGDTDSIKILCKRENISKVDEALNVYAKAIDDAKKDNCARVKVCYPKLYNSLDFIGHYVREFETSYFCASWNKAYCIFDGSHFEFVIAGLPTYRGINDKADKLYKQGYSFEQICNIFLGYNVTFSYDLIKLNNRVFPRWGSLCVENVIDYLGNTSKVIEPNVLALYPFGKTINNTDRPENYSNMRIAIKNNPDVNCDSIIVTEDNIYNVEEIAYG